MNYRYYMTLSSEYYRKFRLTPSSTSDLEILTQIPTSMIQWISSWLVGRSKIRIITAGTAKRNGNISSIFPLSGCHALEVGCSCTHDYELTHGGKTQEIHFTCTWLGQRPDKNWDCKVLFPHDMRSSPAQLPVGPGAGLKLRIGPWLGAINCVSE